MMASVPNDIRSEVRELVWNRAEELDWARMSPAEKAKQYEAWVDDPRVGGVLAKFIDKGAVRVYLKDTLLKSFTRERSGDPTAAMRALGIEPDTSVAAEYIKPHGRTFADGRTIIWGPADHWKAIVTAMHERTYGRPNFKATGVMFTGAASRYQSPQHRAMVGEAARMLGIGRVVWADL
jgi:hypothetical protein